MHSGRNSANWLSTACEECIAAFEQAWSSEKPADLVALVAGREPAQQVPLLRELVVIDMELRWQAAANGEPVRDSLGPRPGWRRYLAHYPLLGQLRDLPAAWLAEEYRVAQQWGPPTNHARFLAKFAYHIQELPRWLADIDAELAADGVVPATLPRPCG